MRIQPNSQVTRQPASGMATGSLRSAGDRRPCRNKYPWLARQEFEKPKPNSQAPAVLPLTSLSGDPGPEYFADFYAAFLDMPVPNCRSLRIVMQHIHVGQRASYRLVAYGNRQVFRPLEFDTVDDLLQALDPAPFTLRRRSAKRQWSV